MEIRKVKKLNTNDIELDSVIETILETETIIQMLEINYYRTSMEKADTSDVNINHLENIFSNKGENLLCVHSFFTGILKSCMV